MLKVSSYFRQTIINNIKVIPFTEVRHERRLDSRVCSLRCAVAMFATARGRAYDYTRWLFQLDSRPFLHTTKMHSYSV